MTYQSVMAPGTFDNTTSIVTGGVSGIGRCIAHEIASLGGRVVVTAGDRRMVVPIVGGGSYLCNGDSRLLIGLADWDRPVDVKVFWPSGQMDVFQNLQADCYWMLMEGDGSPRHWSKIKRVAHGERT